MEQMRKKFSGDQGLYNPSLMGSDLHIPGIPVGTTFESRAECANKGIHTRAFAGIVGKLSEGAKSICVSSSYEDDKDLGDFLIYTGTGGKPDSFSSSGPQVEDQSFEHHDNAVLKLSCETSKPVRVVRGPNPNSAYAPASGYRYDGLYVVEKAYMHKGKSGFYVCRFELRRLPGQPPIRRKPAVRKQ